MAKPNNNDCKKVVHISSKVILGSNTANVHKQINKKAIKVNDLFGLIIKHRINVGGNFFRKAVRVGIIVSEAHFMLSCYFKKSLIIIGKLFN